MTAGTAYPHRHPLASDAPLLAEVVGLEDGEAGLRRRIDPVFAGDVKVRDAFVAEIHALARVPKGSLSLVPLVDADVNGDPWLVREYAEDGTVETLLREGPLSGGELLTVLQALLLALDELGALGLAHGDPSPSNLLLTRTGRVRLADPMSSRRAFAEEAPGAVDLARRDRETALAWLAAAAAASAEGDPLAAELRDRLASSSPDIAIVRGRRLAEERPSALRLLRRPRPRPVAADEARSVAPVPLTVAAGPFSVPRIAYQMSRALAEASREPLESVRRELESGTKVVTLPWPDPARAVLEAAARVGAKIDVRRATAAAQADSRPLR